MSIALNELRVQNSIASGEKLIVAGATAEVQIDYDVLARAIVEQWSGSTLAGSSQSVKSAIDAAQTTSETLNTNIAELQTRISQVASGTPEPVNTIAEMTNHSKIYVYTGSEQGESTGYWYRYDSTQNKFVPGGVYGGAVTSTTFNQPGVPADDFAVGEALAAKADADDVESLTEDIADLKDDLSELETGGAVSSAEQLLSDNYTIDQTPYLYRQTNSNGADRAYEEIVGGSVVWNQLLENGNFASTSGWNVSRATISATNNVLTATSDGSGYVAVNHNVPYNCANHKMLIMFGVMASDNSKKIDAALSATSINNNKFLNAYELQASNTWYDLSHIYMPTDSSATQIRVGCNGMASGDTFSLRNFNVFDLTAMFGTTIADYIYNLEQSSTGAGVEFFRKLFPGDYYEYDAGTMRHVSGVSVKGSKGKNLIEIGLRSRTAEGVTFTQNADGSVTMNGTATRTVGFELFSDITKLNLKAGETYHIQLFEQSNNLQIQVYVDAAYYINTTGGDVTFTIPRTAKLSYARIRVGEGTVLNNVTVYPTVSLVALEKYSVPFTKSYQLDSSLTLRGIPKLDSNNQLYYDGDTYASDGTVTRKYGIVDLGTLTWSTNDSAFDGMREFVTTVTNKAGGVLNIVCATLLPNSSTGANGYKCIRGRANNNTVSVVWDNMAISDFKAAMSGVMLVYELATPTTETAEPYTNPQICDPYGAEEFVSTSLVPVGHNTKYPENLRAKLENLDLSMIAPIETGTTASQAYAVGKYFLLNNKFCKAKTAIASGATFTLNTNYTVTTIADELYAALH